MLYTNVDQFINKRDDLIMTITGAEPDIILLTEVIPKAQKLPIPPALLALPNFVTHLNFDPAKPHLGTSGQRGLAIFIAEHLKAGEIEFPANSFSEQLWVRVRLRGGDALTAGCIYRSPNSSVENTMELCKLLEEASASSTTHLLIVGDFNLSDIDWDSGLSVAPANHVSHSFLEATRNSFLFQHVDAPTRFRQGNTPHILDLVFTNEEGMISNLTSHPGLGSSDHTILRFNLECYTTKIERNAPKLALDRGDYQRMAHLIEDAPWATLEDSGVGEYYNFFSHQLEQAAGA